MTDLVTSPDTSARFVSREDPDYEPMRLGAVWNERKPERYPEAIMLAQTVGDVVAAVREARARGWHVGIRSGGHSWVGNGVRDGGLLLDLSAFDAVEVDVEAGIAKVQPAARSQAIWEAVSKHGFFFPTGHVPTVGVGGFIIGGGYGWNSRALGPACLSIVAADLVLADGSFVHADDSTHPDLMWALRGSGPGFFAIVTCFYLRLYPAYEQILRTSITYPERLRDQVLTHTYGALAAVPREVEISAKVGNAPFGGRVVTVTATAFVGPETPADPLGYFDRAPFRDQAIRAVISQPVTMPELYALADGLNPEGLRWSLDGVWLNGDAGTLVEHAREVNDTIPAGASFVLWMVWGAYPRQENACWSSQAAVYLSPNAGWRDAADDLAMETWTNATMERLQKFSQGIQFSDNNVADRWDAGIGEAEAQRLEELRAVYDPDRLLNTYMRPEESTTAWGKSRR